MKRALLAITAAALFFGAAAVDLAFRSRSALKAARRYEAWAADPAAKKAYCDARLAADLAEIKAGLAAGRLPPDEAARRAGRAEAAAARLRAESAARLAWLWYKTAADKFASPLNPWAAEARRRLPAAAEAWRAELAAAGRKPPDWLAD